MTRPTRNLRLFVAIYPPPDTATALLEALGELDLPAHRPTPVGQVHMTLQFIGDTPVKEMERTIESVERSSSGLGPFDLTIHSLISLPERGRKRLVAAEADRPATLMEMQRRLATRLARKPRRRPGDRFRPHFTLCRFRKPAKMEPLEFALEKIMFPVRRVALMRSELHSEGAKHALVAAVDLG